MSSSIFENCRIYIVPNGLLKKRIELFEEQIIKYGGQCVSNTKSITPTHVIVEDSYIVDENRLKNVLKTVELDYDELKCDIVVTLWLSKCIKERKILDTENFKLKRKRRIEEENQAVEDKPSEKILKAEDTVCDRSSSEHCDEKLPVNEAVIREFQKLADAYRANGDKWRTLAYDKAIASLKSWHQPYSTIDDIKTLPHISGKMLDKISEIIESGSCSKVEEVCSDEKTQVLETFGKIWGAGHVTAKIWYQKGFRTLEDLRTKANLTWQQEIGMKYYNEIQERIPRKEVEEIVDFVKREVNDVDNTIQVMACGSFRRGASTCGDIDVLVIARHSPFVLHKIIAKLKAKNFLVDDLSVGKDETSTTYLGLCKLPGESSKIRRLDIFVVRNNMIGCAIVHYTGSAVFNRELRKHAAKMNMKLTEYRLTCNGKVLPTPTEESVFMHLKIEYRRPEDRETFKVRYLS